MWLRQQRSLSFAFQRESFHQKMWPLKKILKFFSANSIFTLPTVQMEMMMLVHWNKISTKWFLSSLAVFKMHRTLYWNDFGLGTPDVKSVDDLWLSWLLGPGCDSSHHTLLVNDNFEIVYCLKNGNICAFKRLLDEIIFFYYWTHFVFIFYFSLFLKT